MRVIASIIYYLLAWLRGPLLIFLQLASGFFMLTLILVVCLFFALPPQHGQHAVLVKLICISFVGSFGAFLLRRGYDAMLFKLNLFRSGAGRRGYGTAGVR
jgi:hypothetical protein